MPLLNLPEEVLLTILSDLNARDILSFATVSRYTKNFYESSSRLQYIVELDAAGCLDTSFGISRASSKEISTNFSDEKETNVTISEKLQYLRTREARWRELDLTKNAKNTIPLERPMQVSVYDLSAGVFAFAEVERENELFWIDLREVSRRGMVGKGKEALVMTRTFSSSTTLTSPGHGSLENATDAAAANRQEWENGVESVQTELPRTDMPWQKFPFDGQVADFGLALREHDLIVIVSFNVKDQGNPLNLPSMHEIKLNLYEFSTRRPHRRAEETVLKLAEKPSTYQRPSPLIEVAGKYIVVILTFPRAVVEEVIDDLFVINWQTGSVVYHRTYNTCTYCSLAFVTPSLFVMPNLKGNALDLVHIFTAPDGMERVAWLRKLRLPELTDNFKLRNTTCRGDPNPTEDTSDILNPNSGTRTAEVLDTQSDSESGHDGKKRQWGAAGYGITVDPLRAIISLKFIMVPEDTEIPSWGPAMNCIVHRSTLASLALEGLEERKQAVVRQAHSGELESSPDAEIPETKWADWGPPATRWRLEDDYVEWITTTAGQRQVFASLTSETIWRPIIVVRDYNPYEVRRAKARAEAAATVAAAAPGESGDKDEKIYVDSVDGENANNSEDEDEFGLGERAWIVDDGHDNNIIDTAEVEELEAQVLAESQGGDVQPQTEELPNGVNASSAQGGVNMDDMVLDWHPENWNGNGNGEELQDEDSDPVPGTNMTSSSGFYSRLQDLLAPPATAPPDSAVSPSASQSTSITVPSSPAPPEAFQSIASIDEVISHHYPNVPSLKRSSVRVRDTIASPTVRYYKKGELRGGLPCVEYVIEGNEFLYTGLLIDEERIVGYLESVDNPEQIEQMLKMSVFSMYP